MIWLILLTVRLRHQRIYVEQRGRGFIWTGVVGWVTPWVLALRVSYDEPETVHTVYIPLREIECIRDFSPSAARNDLDDSYKAGVTK